ncbi:hypothetical protein KR222_010992 [Zaprionus bogoriensis]|nr:hypothetical protein KR222_010992 [Zaprionus bogoriensis]
MKDLDLTLDYRENARFNYIYGTAILRLERALFSETELLCITMIYHKFVIQNGMKAKFVTTRQLHNLILVVFRITDMRIRSRVVKAICYDPSCKDPAYSPIHHCTLDSFVRMISIYFSTDMELRMRFAFSVYDEHSTGYLTREQVMQYIEVFFEGEDDDELMELRSDMLEIIFAKFDLDKDLTISYEEYASIVYKQPKMLEFLGNVFPSDVQLNVIAHCFNLWT